MSFTRTASGLGNQHLFYQVDYIIYTEGGDKTLSLTDIENGSSNDRAVDKVFWNAVFQKFAFPYKYKIKCVGGKKAVLSIAEKIVKSNLSGALAAMDRDYDFIEKRYIKDPRVLYTYGYSWENDIWQKDQVVCFAENLLQGQEISAQELKKVEKVYSAFFRKLERLSIIQHAYKENGLDFIKSCEVESFISRGSGYPELNTSRLQTVNLTSKKTRLSQSIKISKLKSLRKQGRDITGKLLRSFGYDVLRNLCKKVFGRGSFIPKNFIDSSIISFCSNHNKMHMDNYTFNHYKNSFDGLISHCT